MFAPQDYDYLIVPTSNYDEVKKKFVEAYGHYLNYNHEQAIACFSAGNGP